VKVVVDDRYWIDKEDIDADCVGVSDPTPVASTTKNRIFTGVTANGKVPLGLTQSIKYLWYEDVQDLGLNGLQIKALSEITDRNRVCGIDVIQRDPADVPTVHLDTKREIAAFTWPRDSHARDGATCGSIQSGTVGNNTEDRLNLGIDFGVVLAIHISNDLKHSDWGFDEYVVLWDRCGYAQLRFYPESATLRFCVERNDDHTASVWLPDPLGADNFYFIIAAYQWRKVGGVYSGGLRLGFYDSATLNVADATVVGHAGTKEECSVRSSPLGSMTLLSDWREQHQATTTAIGTIIAARVDREDADWPTSYFKDIDSFRFYLRHMCAADQNAGAGITLGNEPGTVWSIHPEQTDLILDKSEKKGFDATCRGDQWEIVDVDVPADFDSRCYAESCYLGALRFILYIPDGVVGDITGNDRNFTLYDTLGNREDITSDRIKSIQPWPQLVADPAFQPKLWSYGTILDGVGDIPNIKVKYYKIILNDDDAGLAFAYDSQVYPYDMSWVNMTAPNGLAFMQKIDHTKVSLGLVAASVGNICYTRKIVPSHYYKLAYLGFRDGGVGADSYSIHFAYSNDLVSWFVNQREVPLYKTSNPISKIFAEPEGRKTSIFISDDTGNTIDLIRTDDDTGFDTAMLENIGPVLFPRDGKYDSNGVSAPSITMAKDGWWCLMHSTEDDVGVRGFGRVYSDKFNLWNRRRATETFHSHNNNLMDEVAIYDPSRFFDNNGPQYMAYTGEDIAGVFGILFAKLTEEDDFSDQDFPEGFEEVVTYDLASKCRGLFDYRASEEKCILAVFKQAILKDNNDGIFRLLRTHFRVIGDLWKTNTMTPIPLDEYFFDESFEHAVITTGNFPNQKYYRGMDFTTFLGKEQAHAPFDPGSKAPGSLTDLWSYKYRVSWESATIEGNVSDPSAAIVIIAPNLTATFRATLPHRAHAATTLEDHDRAIRINIYRKSWLTADAEPDPTDTENNQYFWVAARTIVAADWLTPVSYVDITDNGDPGPTSRQPYYDGHEIGPNAKFCLNHPSSNRLLLFDHTNMFYSETDFKEAFPPSNELNLDDGSGDGIMGVCLWNDDVYIFFQKKVVKIVFRGDDDIYPQIISRSIGVISTRSIAPSPQGVFALTNDGIRILTDTGWSEDISKDMKPYLDDAIRISGAMFPEDLSGDYAHARNGVAISPGAFFDDKYYLDIMENTNCPRIRLVYSVKRRTWSVHEEFLSGVLLSVVFGERKLLWGSATKAILYKVGGISDRGLPIQARAITKEFDLGRLDLFKQFYEMFPSINAENGSMLITAICDRGVENYVSMFATPERVAFFNFVPAAGLAARGGALAASGPLGLAGPMILELAGMSSSRSKRRAVLPDTMIGKKISFEFYDNGFGAPSEIKSISFSFTFEDSEL